MIIDKETSAFWRKILQPIEFVPMPEPGVRVPDGGHNLPSSQQQVSSLNTFRQSSYQSLSVSFVDVKHQGGEVNQKQYHTENNKLYAYVTF